MEPVIGCAAHFWISGPIFLGPVLAIWGYIKYSGWRHRNDPVDESAPEADALTSEERAALFGDEVADTEGDLAMTR